MKQANTATQQMNSRHSSQQRSDAYQVRTSLDISIGVPALSSTHDYRSDPACSTRLTRQDKR